MHKKVFIKNRPFDIIDAADMQNWTEDALKTTMKTMYNFGVVQGLNVTVKSALQLYVNIGYAFDSNYDIIDVKSQQTISLAAANTNPRYDLIVIKNKKAIYDNIDTTGNKYGMGTSYIYSQNNLDEFEISIVTGTPATSPVVPAQPAGTLKLAQVLVPANAVSIVTGNITDVRQMLAINQNINTPEVVIGPTQPGSTSVLWLDTTSKKLKFYDTVGAIWDVPNAKNADTLGGNLPSAFATASHNHDNLYYTETEVNTLLAGKSDTSHTHGWAAITGKPTTFPPDAHNHDSLYYTETEINTLLSGKSDTSHNHDSRYYTETELNTSGGGGQVHYNNITNKPATFPPDSHNHDNLYYTETESDAKYLQKSDNLNSLSDKATARTNLGLGTMATESTSAYATSTHNHDTVYVPLTDVTTTPTANKILKLDSTSKAPASIITQDSNNRFVTDAEKTTWNAKASTAVVTTTANGLMEFNDKIKLNGIAPGATNYSHPATHPATMITEDTTHRFITDSERIAWNGKESIDGVRQKVEQTDFKIYKTIKDANGIYTTVEYKRADNTLAVKSVLSGGTSPRYTTRTITYYGLNGTTVEKTTTRTLSYDVDGDLSSEV